jgi:hypothetical protein
MGGAGEAKIGKRKYRLLMNMMEIFCLAMVPATTITHSKPLLTTNCLTLHIK